jgi:hypothetical protein
VWGVQMIWGGEGGGDDTLGPVCGFGCFCGTVA